MGSVPPFASPAHAADAVLAGLRYLAAVDPTQLMVGEQARLLVVTERARATGTVAQARVCGRSRPCRASTRTGITVPSRGR